MVRKSLRSQEIVKGEQRGRLMVLIKTQNDCKMASNGLESERRAAANFRREGGGKEKDLRFTSYPVDDVHQAQITFGWGGGTFREDKMRDRTLPGVERVNHQSSGRW